MLDDDMLAVMMYVDGDDDDTLLAVMMDGDADDDDMLLAVMDGDGDDDARGEDIRRRLREGRRGRGEGLS